MIVANISVFLLLQTIQMGNKHNKRKPSKRGRGRPRKSVLNHNLKRNQASKERRIEINKSKTHRINFTKSEMKQLLDLCPSHNEFFYSEEEKSEWIKLCDSPTCDYSNLCEKVIKFLKRKPDFVAEKVVPDSVFDGRHDKILQGFLMKKSGDTGWHTDNKKPMQYRDMRTLLICMGGVGKAEFQVVLGYTLNGAPNAQNLNDDDFVVEKFDFSTGIGVLFPCFCQHGLIQEEEGEHINLVLTICFKSLCRSGRNVNIITNK